MQEALTNALKHAGSKARVDVELEYAPTWLRLAVRSRAAHGPQRPLVESNGTLGRGLIGMRERIGMHGGQLSVKTLDDGTFEVLATIPV